MAKFGMVPRAVFHACQGQRIDVTAIAVYAALASFANKNGVCFPSSGRIQAMTGRKERAVRRALRSLEQAGLLKTDYRDGTSSLYTLLKHPKK